MEFSLAFYVLSQDSNGFSMILLGLTSCCWFLMVFTGLNKVFVDISEFYTVNIEYEGFHVDLLGFLWLPGIGFAWRFGARGGRPETGAVAVVGRGGGGGGGGRDGRGAGSGRGRVGGRGGAGAGRRGGAAAAGGVVRVLAAGRRRTGEARAAEHGERVRTVALAAPRQLADLSSLSSLSDQHKSFVTYSLFMVSSLFSWPILSLSLFSSRNFRVFFDSRKL